MPASVVAKQFTLHDIIGYMFSGSIVCLGVFGYYHVLDVHSDDVSWLKSLRLGFATLHVGTQVGVLVVIAYLLGVVSTFVGEMLYRNVYCRARYYYARVYYRVFGGPEPAQFGEKVLWENSKQKISPTMNNLLVQRIRATAGIPSSDQVSNQDLLTFAYCHLMALGKDSFVQLMSGRCAMFMGLSGAVILIVIISSIGMACLGIRLTSPWTFWSLQILMLLIGEFLCLTMGRHFHHWFEHHIAHGFVALPRTTQGSESDSPEPTGTE